MNSFNLIGLAAIVFVSVSFVVCGDIAGKLLMARGVDPVIVAWARVTLAALIFLPVSGLRRLDLAALINWRVLLRAGVITCVIYCILIALRTEPIANVFGAFFIGPIVAYCLAAVILGEQPSVLRVCLLVLGFAGVMLVVKPGVGMSLGMIFALVAGILYGVYLTLTRAVADKYSPRFLLSSQLVIGALLLTPLGFGSNFPALNLPISLLFLASAFCSAIGNFLLVVANKKAEATLIAPLVYTQLISATLAGIIVFDEWPDGYSLAGLALIMFSGFGSLVAHRQTTKPEKSARRTSSRFFKAA